MKNLEPIEVVYGLVEALAAFCAQVLFNGIPAIDFVAMVHGEDPDAWPANVRWHLISDGFDPETTDDPSEEADTWRRSHLPTYLDI